MVNKIKKILVNGMRWTFEVLFRLVPIHKKMVLFISFHGRGYSDNPKAIFLQMKKDERFKDYVFVWALRKENMIEIEGAKVIPYFTPVYFFHLARSKYWVCNCKLQKYIVRKKKQVYLQTWHGTPLKRLAHDIIVPEGTTFYRSHMSADAMRKTYDNDVKKYTYMISPNKFCTEVFQSAFQINRERLIETGYPRNDYLSNVTEEEKQAIRKKLYIPDNKKIILYAPTWRDNQFTMAGYTFELKVDFMKWKEVLGEEYVILFKPHYLITSTYKHEPELENFVYDIDAKSDISDLYVISDMMVTDYSSVFFDYAVLKRPMYFYMYDIEEYADELRGFYLDIHKDLPGEVFKIEEAMLQAIANHLFDYDKLETFNQRFNNREDGHAAQRVIDIMCS
ncbi:CDP-glycerol glycerophosphotransferase family protein [Amedibacillus sp. YH-ame10]